MLMTNTKLLSGLAKVVNGSAVPTITSVMNIDEAKTRAA